MGRIKTKYANYTAVKDAAILKMQKTLHDEVIASVRDEELVDRNDSKPIRKLGGPTKPTRKRKSKKIYSTKTNIK